MNTATTESNVFVMIDTYNNGGLEYRDYLDFCEVNEIEPAAEDSNDYYEWLGEESQRFWEDFIDNLSYGKCTYPLLITGSLGLWTGSHDIEPVLVESEDYHQNGNYYSKPSMKTAILKCLGSCDDIKITYNDGIIEVDAMHHDGTNSFYIKKLTDVGYEAALEERWDDMTYEWFEPIEPGDIYE